MAEVINTNVIEAGKKFVDLSGLDYFWGKAKTYIDGVDATMSAKVLKNEQDISSIQDELNSLSGGAGSIATQIDNAIAALKLPETYDAKGSAATAEQNAKDYVDGKVDGKFDAAGAAASALTEAKSYVDGKVDGKFDAAGSASAAETAAKTYADGLNSTMSGRVDALEAIDHDKLAADAAAAAVTTVLDGAPEKFDTLKEVAQWIADSESAATAADLVTRVSALEAIDHDAYVDADATVLADAKSYVDGKVDNKFDAAGSADAALADAKEYANGLASNYDAAGSADAALAAAKADAASLYQVKGNYETAGSAAQALADAKSYVDGKVDGKFDAAGSAATAKSEAIAQAKLDAADALKSYYTKTEVDNLLSTNSTGDRAYAKQYTDELFNSFAFVANSDIDALFAPKTEA